jgi:hypothetical protein
MSSSNADGLTQRKGKKGGNNSSEKAHLLDKEDKPKPFKQSSSYLNLDPVSEKNLVRDGDWLGWDVEEGWEEEGGQAGGLLHLRGVGREEVRCVSVDTHECARPMYKGISRDSVGHVCIGKHS